jgi:hypothetical protein
MGEVIVFKLEKNGTHLRPPPEGSAKIFFSLVFGKSP